MLGNSQENQVDIQGMPKSRHFSVNKNLAVRMFEKDEDIEVIWPLCQLFHQESRYRNLSISKELLTEHIKNNYLKNRYKYGIFIAELGGRPVGFLACTISRMVYTEYQSASVLAFYVLPSCRKTLAAGNIVLKLLHDYRLWAKRRRAVEIQMHVTHGFALERVNRFLIKLGFNLSGGNYSMRI